MMKQLYILLALIFCVTCSTTAPKIEVLAKPGVDYIITANDQPLDERFLITIKSTSKRDICLYSGTWPSLLTYRQHPHRGELIRDLDAEVRIVSETASYNPRNPTTGGHCQTSEVEDAQKVCSQRLEPGQTRMTTLPYRYFDLAMFDDTDKNKQLNYSANLPFCDVFP